MSVILTKDEPIEQKPVGLVDGGKYLLKCQYCNSPLMELWIVNPDYKFRDGTPYSYNYKATCPYCQCGSEPKHIKGEVRFLNIVEEKDGIEKNITIINGIDVDESEDLCIIEILKYEPRKPKVTKNP